MATIKVIELIGDGSLLASDKGIRLYNAIRDQLKAGHKVEVDFTGYEYLSSTFLNHSLGQITIDFGMDPKKFSERIDVVGLNEDDISDAQLSVQNADHRRRLLEKGIDPQTYYSTHVSY